MVPIESSSIPSQPFVNPDSPSRLPPEIWTKIFSLSVPSHIYLSTDEVEERYSTLKTLCLVSRTANALALPLLFQHVCFNWDTRGRLLTLLKVLVNHEGRADLVRKLEFRFDLFRFDLGEGVDEVASRHEGIPELVTAVIAKCSPVEELVLDSLPQTQSLPIILQLVSNHLKKLILKNIGWTPTSFTCSFPHLRLVILYDVSMRDELDLFPARFPNLETLVYFNPADHATSRPFPRLKHLALMHWELLPAFRSLDPNFTTVHFSPSGYYGGRNRIPTDWLEILDGTEKNVRFRVDKMSGDPEMILGSMGMLEMLFEHSKLESISFPQFWFEEDRWRDVREELGQRCRERGVVLEFEEKGCNDVEYFLRTEWWKVPRKETTGIEGVA